MVGHYAILMYTISIHIRIMSCYTASMYVNVVPEVTGLFL